MRPQECKRVPANEASESISVRSRHQSRKTSCNTVRNNGYTLTQLAELVRQHDVVPLDTARLTDGTSSFPCPWPTDAPIPPLLECLSEVV